MNVKWRGAPLGALIGLSALIPAAAVAWPSRVRLDSALQAIERPEESDRSELEALTAEYEEIRKTAAPDVAASARLVALRIPTTSRALERLHAVSDAAEKQGVVLRSSMDLPPRDGDDHAYRLYGLEISATGSYDALVAFVDALETGRHFTLFEKLDIRRGEFAPPHLSATFTIRFPVRTRAPDPTELLTHPALAEALR